MPDVMPYVFVAATSFSGSTLLAMLLDTHPKIASIGEVANSIRRVIAEGEVVEYPCSCGEPIRQCPFFREVQAYCAGHDMELDLHDFQTGLGENLSLYKRRLLFGAAQRFAWLEGIRDGLLATIPSYRRHVKRVFDRTETTARGVLEVTGKRVFLDASKTVARVAHLLNRNGLDLRVIHLVRDVRGFTYSSLKRGRTTVEGAARSWVRTHSVALRLKKALGNDRYLLLRWEDFCRDPGGKLDAICSFIGVEPAEMVSRVNDEPHHVIGNPVRLKPVGEIRSDESWKQFLHPEQVTACERAAKGLNRLLGYA